MYYEKKLSIGDYVQGQRTYSGEIIKGVFNGFHLVDKQDPSSVVGVIYVESDRCYDAIAKSVVLIEKKQSTVRHQGRRREMTTEEKAKEIRNRNVCCVYSDCPNVYHAAMKMAEWKKRQMIARACSWLLLNAGVFGFFKKIKLQRMVDEFEKAMKGGEQ